jgi:hypothetical protein
MKTVDVLTNITLQTRRIIIIIIGGGGGHNRGQYHNMKTDIIFFKNVAKLNYFGTPATNQITVPKNLGGN